jgi:hypothetical protein
MAEPDNHPPVTSRRRFLRGAVAGGIAGGSLGGEARAETSLSDTDVYAVSAYVLHLNGLLPADATLDAKTLSALKMPNRVMFVGDPRPDVKNPACTKDC